MSFIRAILAPGFAWHRAWFRLGTGGSGDARAGRAEGLVFPPADVDKRLSENVNAPIRLRPDGRVIPSLLTQLAGTAFKGKTVKVRSRGDQGKLLVETLDTAIAAQDDAARMK